LEENARKWEEDQKDKNLDFYRGLVVARLPVQIPPRVAETRQFHGEQECVVF
jgi:hypothetical protein